MISFNTMTKFKGHAKRPISRPGSKVKGQCQTRTTQRVSSLRAFWRLENTFTAVLKLTFKGTRLRANSFSAFWRRKNAIFAESWNPCYKSSYLCVNTFAPLWRPENVSFNSWSCENTKFAARVKHEWHIARSHFVQFGPLKIYLLPSLQTHFQGYLASCELIFCILEAWKCVFSDSWNPCFKGT